MLKYFKSPYAFKLEKGVTCRFDEDDQTGCVSDRK